MHPGGNLTGAVLSCTPDSDLWESLMPPVLGCDGEILGLQPCSGQGVLLHSGSDGMRNLAASGLWTHT